MVKKTNSILKKAAQMISKAAGARAAKKNSREIAKA
jgi:hypothetical protein